MRKITAVLIFVLISTFVFGQVESEVVKLVKIGVQHHDKGEFDKAIDAYKKALAIDGKSALVHYELAMTYMYKKDYENALKHSDKVLALGKKHNLAAYITKGSSLDCLGRTDESIKLFQKAIKDFGPHYLLCYNLAFNNFKIKKYKEAERVLIQGISNNSDHTSSHLLLASVMAEQDKKVQSIMCLYYFLFLEFESRRSVNAYSFLRNLLNSKTQTDKKDPNVVNVLIDEANKDSEFGPVDMTLALIQASRTLEENKDKSDEELFVENTGSFFRCLKEHNKPENKGVWWDLYAQRLSKIEESGHIEAYSYVIMSASDKKARAWFKANSSKLKNYVQWLKKDQT